MCFVLFCFLLMKLLNQSGYFYSRFLDLNNFEKRMSNLNFLVGTVTVLRGH